MIQVSDDAGLPRTSRTNDKNGILTFEFLHMVVLQLAVVVQLEEVDAEQVGVNIF